MNILFIELKKLHFLRKFREIDLDFKLEDDLLKKQTKCDSALPTAKLGVLKRPSHHYIIEIGKNEKFMGYLYRIPIVQNKAVLQYQNFYCEEMSHE